MVKTCAAGGCRSNSPSENWILQGMDSDALFQRKKRKVYVSYDHHADARYYDRFRKQFATRMHALIRHYFENTRVWEDAFVRGEA